MASIGSVTKREDGRCEGELRTLSVRAEISIVPVTDKGSPNQPDYRVLSGGIEVGAGRHRTSQTSGKEYVSLSISAPELGQIFLMPCPLTDTEPSGFFVSDASCATALGTSANSAPRRPTC